MSSTSSTPSSSPALSRVSSANHLPTYPSASPSLSNDLVLAIDELARLPPAAKKPSSSSSSSGRRNFGLRISTDVGLFPAVVEETADEQETTPRAGAENPRAPPSSPVDFPAGLAGERWTWEKDEDLDLASVSSRGSS